MELNKLLPHDKKFEELILGTIMYERDALYKIGELISENTFYDLFHQKVYKAITKIDSRGESPDLITVVNELRKSEPNVDLARLSGISANHSFDVYQHALILSEKEKRRSLIELSYRLNNMAFDESQDIYEAMNETEESLKNLVSSSSSSISTMKDAIRSVMDQVNRNHVLSSGLTGTPTGFTQFDNRSGGLQKSDLIIIAGETSQGKTSLAVSMGLNAAMSDSSIAVYSMEMKKEQIAARMMSIKSGVPANQILFSRMMPEQFEHIDKGISSLHDRKIYFDDRSTSNIDTIISSIRSMKKKYNIDGVVVDYLQILNVNMKGANPEQQMGSAARRLKNLAKDLDIWIVALSQLSRDNTNPVPTLNRLRDSGQIGEAADVVILVYRPEVYGKLYPEPFNYISTTGTAMIDVAKGRNIGLLKFVCGFSKETTRFYDLEELEFVERDNEDEPF